MRKMTPSYHLVNVVGSRKPVQHVDQRGTQQQAYQQFTKDRRQPDSLARHTGRLGSRNHQRQREGRLQEWFHVVCASNFVP